MARRRKSTPVPAPAPTWDDVRNLEATADWCRDNRYHDAAKNFMREASRAAARLRRAPAPDTD
jgi:hypothetical protein